MKKSLDKSQIRFLLLEGVHPNAIKSLNQAGYNNIETVDHALDGQALIDKIKNAHFLGIRSRTQLTNKVLVHAKKLVGIGCFCIGTNQVDTNAALALGIPVFNAPYSNTRSVAELVLAEIILLLRRIPEMHTQIKQDNWNKSATNSNETRGKTLGIIGYGSIGSQLSIMAESLGMNVIYYDIVTKLPIGNARQVASLNDLLSQADAISLHVPDNTSTRNIIGNEQIKLMKKSAVFINAARGQCVDITALYNALKSQNLRGAAIDVFPEEPKSNGSPLDSILTTLDNIILTPHIGGSTQEAQANIGLEVADKLINYSDTGNTLSAVNFPEVNIQAIKGVHRLLHIHKNLPGVLSKVNDLFSSHQINISAQHLMTKGEIGYLVMDIDEFDSQLAIQKLKQIEETIKARVIF